MPNNNNQPQHFFLPSFSRTRPSSNANGANLATVGLFSALAACGGSGSSGGNDYIPPTNYLKQPSATGRGSDGKGLIISRVNGEADGTRHQPYYEKSMATGKDTKEFLHIIPDYNSTIRNQTNSLDSMNQPVPVDQTKPNGPFVKIIDSWGADIERAYSETTYTTVTVTTDAKGTTEHKVAVRDINKDFSFRVEAPKPLIGDRHTIQDGLNYDSDDLNRDGADELVIASQAQSHDPAMISILWDFAKNPDAFNSLTFSFADSTFHNTAGDEITGAGAPHALTLQTTQSLAATDVQIGDINGNPVMFVSNFGYDNYSGKTAIVWNPGQYDQANTTINIDDGDITGSSATAAITHIAGGWSNALLGQAVDGSVEKGFGFPYSLTQLDNDSKVDLIINGYGSAADTGALHIIWDLISHKPTAAINTIALQPATGGNNTPGVLSIFSAEGGEFFFRRPTFTDLDGDGKNDIIAATGTKSGTTSAYIFWGSALRDSEGQGKEGRLTLSKTSDQTTDPITAFTKDSTGDFASAGLQFKPAFENPNADAGSTTLYLEAITDDFRFADLDDDGIKDAISLNANNGSHDWWKMSAAENTVTITGVTYSGNSAASAGTATFAGTKTNSITATELAELGFSANPSASGLDSSFDSQLIDIA